MRILAIMRWMLIHILGSPVNPQTIPFGEARLCVNCESVIQNATCPNCGSTKQIMLGNVLGVKKP